MTGQVLFQADEVSRTISRLAHEIVEKNGGTKDLALLGIRTRGAHLVRRIAAKIEGITGAAPPVGDIDVSAYRDDRSRSAELSKKPATEVPVSVDDKTVVVVDDVIYTGRTIRAALDLISHLGNPKRILVAILVDRGERELPIRADIVGKNVQVANSERVNVRLRESDGIDQITVKSWR